MTGQTHRSAPTIIMPQNFCLTAYFKVLGLPEKEVQRAVLSNSQSSKEVTHAQAIQCEESVGRSPGIIPGNRLLDDNSGSSERSGTSDRAGPYRRRQRCPAIQASEVAATAAGRSRRHHAGRDRRRQL